MDDKLKEAMERLRSEVAHCEETSLESVKLSTEQARALLDAARNAETAEAWAIEKCIEKCMEGAEEAVKAYRTVYTADADGDGLSLDDILTPKGDATIARGIEERDNIIDDIRVAFRSLAPARECCEWSLKADDAGGFEWVTSCGHWHVARSHYEDWPMIGNSKMELCPFKGCGAPITIKEG